VPTYVPIQQAIAEEGVSRSTINRYRRLGLLDSYTSPGVDRRIYIDVERLRELRRNPPLRRIESERETH
jgi:hypothetical protein